jgi:hypothetical protein
MMGTGVMRFSAGAAALLLLCGQTPVLAADAAGGAQPAQPGPLKAGKSAGVEMAQRTPAGLALVGAGAIVAIVAVITTAGAGGAGNQPNNQSVPATTP